MKKFFGALFSVVLLGAVGLLTWRNFLLHKKVGVLQETIAQLEKERRERAQKDTVAESAEVKPESVAEVRKEIEAGTSELRGLSFKKPVRYKMIDRADLHDFLIKKVKEQYTDQEAHDFSRTLAAFGLVPEGTDLLKMMVEMYGEQVAAFYVPEERSLYTFKNLSWSSGLDRMLLSHELTHVLQDQNYDLTTFPLKVKDNDDLALATASLIEGDATLLMTRFYAQDADAVHAWKDMAAMLGQDTTKLRKAPQYLREMLVFPYEQGNQFAMALFSSGGTDALNEAFRHPPVSTQQIMHPDKFIHSRHDPQALTLHPVESKEWRLVGNNVLGEFGIRSLLQPELGLFEAQRIAQAWDGDRYNVYESGPEGPTTGLVWITVWDKEQDAMAFEAAYQTVAQKRGVIAKLNRNGKQVIVRQAGQDAFFALSETAIPQ